MLLAKPVSKRPIPTYEEAQPARSLLARNREVALLHGVTVQQIIDETGKNVKTLLAKITGKFPASLPPGLQLFLVEVQGVDSSLRFVIYEVHFEYDGQCKFRKCE